MSGLPERSVVAYCCYAERAKWNALMVGMSAKQVLAEQQLKDAELKVENTELSCGGMQRTTVGVAIRYFGGAATCRHVYVRRSAAGPPALSLLALFPTSHVAR
ncbi:hypothetical protein ALC53_06078 [Atta colombica]|uniref:Uncharacterized protein n=1 Tax=Atta colombica TaxID=520822 RepID=A0A195BGR6_9HYME|nr:hypothetical protein ALC53_06078 [Atta colombica]